MTTQQPPAVLRAGFVGLGVMGLPMARNLHRAGLPLQVYDIVPEAQERAAAAGLPVAAGLAALIRASDVVVTMLPDTPDVTRVVRGPGGLLDAAAEGLIYVDMSTISPVATTELSRELAAAGVSMIDAPVSGGVQKARSGELSIMAGGSPAALERAAGVLSAMGRVTAMGPSGAGQATKACNQVAVSLTIQAACEAFALGARLGVDLDQLRTALLGGSCASWILENMGPQILAGDDEPGFRVALQVKDLRIASEAAASTSTALPGLATVLGLYTQAMAQGQAADGNQSLARVYERNTGAVIGARRAGSQQKSGR
jgi:2-hydroxy-3-oxopropionate reductase